jgi:hypothetical protein
MAQSLDLLLPNSTIDEQDSYSSRNKYGQYFKIEKTIGGGYRKTLYEDSAMTREIGYKRHGSNGVT